MEIFNLGTILEVVFSIVFHLIGATLKLIFGFIGAIIQYFWLPILVIVVIWFIYLYIKVKNIEPGGTNILNIDDAKIGYDIMPPNFKKAFSDGLGMRHSCGTCTHCNNIRGKEPVCTKYGVRYNGHACLDKTVCDDYNNVLF